MRQLRLTTVCCTAALALLASFGDPPCTAVPAVGAVGSGSGGAFGVPVLAGLGLPAIGAPGSFAFRLTGGVPHAPGLLILARREQPMFSSVYQTTVYTGAHGVMVPFILDASGTATVAPAATNAPIAELCGMDLIAQAVVFDFTAPGGGAWSNGLRFRFGAAP